MSQRATYRSQACRLAGNLYGTTYNGGVFGAATDFIFPGEVSKLFV
jgi:hypothetical protein